MFLGWGSRRSAPAFPGQSYGLRFRIPRIKPGPYEFVAFCDACSPGPSGSLIATFSGPNSHNSLQSAPGSALRPMTEARTGLG